MEENKPVEINTFLEPMELTKEMKLKVFAIACIKKELFDREQMDFIKDKLLITLSIGYSDSDAIMGAMSGIRSLGMEPMLYQVPTAIVSKEVQDIIGKIILSEVTPAIPPMEPVIEKVKSQDETKNKSIEVVVASVRMVFDQCGTDAQKKIAEAVINKFLEANVKTGS